MQLRMELAVQVAFAARGFHAPGCFPVVACGAAGRDL